LKSKPALDNSLRQTNLLTRHLNQLLVWYFSCNSFYHIYSSHFQNANTKDQAKMCFAFTAKLNN